MINLTESTGKNVKIEPRPVAAHFLSLSRVASSSIIINSFYRKFKIHAANATFSWNLNRLKAALITAREMLHDDIYHCASRTHQRSHEKKILRPSSTLIAPPSNHPPDNFLKRDTKCTHCFFVNSF